MTWEPIWLIKASRWIKWIFYGSMGALIGVGLLCINVFKIDSMIVMIVYFVLFFGALFILNSQEKSIKMAIRKRRLNAYLTAHPELSTELKNDAENWKINPAMDDELLEIASGFEAWVNREKLDKKD